MPGVELLHGTPPQPHCPHATMPPPRLPPSPPPAPPPFYPYYLADPGVQTCPTGSSPTDSNECDTAAQEILSKLSLTAARPIQVNPNFNPPCGIGAGWGQVPVGCSIQNNWVASGGQVIYGDNAPHLKRGDSNCPFPSPGYSLVCSQTERANLDFTHAIFTKDAKL